MAKINSYRDLEVWQEAMTLVEQVYHLADKLSDSERFGLRSQMQRAAVSVPANIAEGFGRSGRIEYARFIAISRGSLMELETYLALTVRLGMIDRNVMIPVWESAVRLGKRLTALRKSLTRPQAPDTSPH